MEPLQRFLLGGMAAMTEDERRQIRTWLIVPGSAPETGAATSSPPPITLQLLQQEASLSARTYQALKRSGYRLVDAELASDAELCALRNVGLHALQEVRTVLEQPVPDRLPSAYESAGWAPGIRITDDAEFLACFAAGWNCWQVAQKYGYHSDGPVRASRPMSISRYARDAEGPRPPGYGSEWGAWLNAINRRVDADPRRLWLLNQ
jgi:hypothetical protein